MVSRIHIGRSLLLLAFLALAASTGCQKETSTAPTTDAGSLKRVTVNVTGMTCVVGCAPLAREALETLPWAKNVQVDFDRKLATLDAEPAKIDEAAIIAALKAEGFGGTIAK